MFPNRSQIEKAEREIFTEYGTVDLQSLYSLIENRFSMTPEEKSRDDSQGGILIQHEVRWGIQSLKTQGLIERGEKIGVWRLKDNRFHTRPPRVAYNVQRLPCQRKL